MRIADFGISGLAAGQAIGEATRGTTSRGVALATAARGAYTPHYASPQQVLGDDPDPRDDVFALGVIWYQMLTGDLGKGRPGGRSWRRQLAERGMSAEVLDLLESAVDDEPGERPADAARLVEGLAMLLKPKSPPAAETPHQPGAPRSPDPPPPPPLASDFLRRGASDLDKGEHDKAIANFTEAIRLAPGDAAGYEARGNAHLAKQEYDKAAGDFTAVIRLNPEHTSAFLYRGICFSQKQEHDKAIADYTEAIRRSPANSDAYLKRAGGYFEMNEYDKAISDYTEAIRLNPTSSCHYFRGESHAAKGEYDKAIADLTKAIRIDSADLASLNELAWLLATCPIDGLRDGKKAVEHAAKVCDRLRWKDPNSVDTLAAAYAECGDFSEAIRWEKRAIELGFHSEERLEDARGRLALYESGKPFREGQPPEPDLAHRKAEVPADAHPPEAARARRHLPREITNSIGMRLVLIPKGKFLMGSPASSEGMSDAKPQHEVEITEPFYLGACQVTRDEYQRVLGPDGVDAPPEGQDWRQLPVEHVSWEDAVAFCRKLSVLPGERKHHRTYRLPTEAEWEYACRAGSTSNWFFGDDPSDLAVYAWSDRDSADGMNHPIHPVGTKEPNPWGLFDMHGNVWEWCSDWYDSDYYKKSPRTDPQGPRRKSTWRVLRGGAAYCDPDKCRCDERRYGDPTFRDSYCGFRVVCVATAPPR
jgi:formylglycine-generating enzyme required for sulfatase activity/tetratricopeptide (TPR) repeat protein